MNKHQKDMITAVLFNRVLISSVILRLKTRLILLNWSTVSPLVYWLKHEQIAECEYHVSPCLMNYYESAWMKREMSAQVLLFIRKISF